MKFTRLALTAFALGFASVAANAADLLPSQAIAPSYAQPIAAAPNNWTGFYLGGTLGGLWATDSGARMNGSSLDTPRFSSFTAAATSSSDDASFTFGGTLGYNYQFNNAVVAGVELDYNWANSDTNSVFAYSQPVWDGLATYTADGTARAKLNSYGSLRARLGYLVTPAFLIYGTGGVALGNVKTTGSATETLTAFGADMDLGSRFGSKTKTLTGWTVGGGAEYAFNRNWSIKGEYLYTDLGTKKFNFVADNAGVYNFGGEQKHKFSVARVGVNYRF